jgi:hypothetical protein
VGPIHSFQNGDLHQGSYERNIEPTDMKQEFCVQLSACLFSFNKNKKSVMSYTPRVAAVLSLRH